MILSDGVSITMNKKLWVIPPKHNGQFVAHMEDILDVYQRSYDPQVPLVCMDGKPVQLIKETRAPIAAQHGKPERIDYDSARQPRIGPRRSSICGRGSILKLNASV